jgi:hypothetical protein
MLMPQALSAPQMLSTINPTADNSMIARASGITYFTADGYGGKDCTGNKFWSWEVSSGSMFGNLSEREEIKSVWVHHYGQCKDGHVKFQQASAHGVAFSSQSASRGQCLNLQYDAVGAYEIHFWCRLL